MKGRSGNKREDLKKKKEKKKRQKRGQGRQERKVPEAGTGGAGLLICGTAFFCDVDTLQKKKKVTCR